MVAWDYDWMKELQMRTLVDIALVDAVKIQATEHHSYLARGFIVKKGN